MKGNIHILAQETKDLFWEVENKSVNFQLKAAFVWEHSKQFLEFDISLSKMDWHLKKSSFTFLNKKKKKDIIITCMKISTYNNSRFDICKQKLSPTIIKTGTNSDNQTNSSKTNTLNFTKSLTNRKLQKELEGAQVLQTW